MAAYNGVTKRIKNAVVTVLSGITLDTGTGSEPAFAQVLDNTVGEFDGYPSVRVLPGDLDNQNGAWSVQDRGTAFIVRVHEQLEDTPEAESATYDRMYDLTDLIID